MLQPPMSEPPAGSTPKRRLLSLDALRGIAVFLMIEQHVGIWMWRGPDPGRSLFDYPHLVVFNALGGGAAPLFVSLAGVGSALFVAAGRPKTDVTLVRRGLVLMVFGLVLNFLSPSWFSWGSWFVLHMMGFAMALAPIWRRLPDWGLLAACAAVLVATPVVQTWLGTPLVLDNEAMRSLQRPGGPLRLALAEGQFPILPWLTFYLAGMLAGRFIVRDRWPRIAALGLGFIAIGGLGHLLLRLDALPLSRVMATRAFGLQLSFFPASISIATLLLGGALLLIAVVVWFERRFELTDANPLVTLGRASLTLLMLHVPVFRDLSRPVGLWRGLSAEGALVTIFVFFGLAAILTRLWQRVGYRYGAEWTLRKLAG
jgi:uncharacterized membrane protein